MPYDVDVCCCCVYLTNVVPVVVEYLGTVNTYDVCESAPVLGYTDTLLVLLLLLLLFVLVHLPPKVFIQQYLPILSYISIRTNALYCGSSVHRLAVQSPFLWDLGLPTVVSYLFSPLRACAKQQACVGLPRRSPLVYTEITRFPFRMWVT